MTSISHSLDASPETPTLSAAAPGEPLADARLLQSIFRTMPIGIGVVRERVIHEVNDGLCAMLGYQREELIGQSSRICYPDDAEFERVGREKYAKLYATGHGEIEARLRHRDGHELDVLLGSNQLDPDDPGAGFVFTVTDIGARKQAELQAWESETLFTRVFHAAGTMLTLSSLPDGIYEHVNNAFVTISGFSREEVVGSSSVNMGFISASERQRLLAAMDTDGHIHNLELHLRCKNGRLINVLYNGEVLEIGGEKKLLSIAHDITPLKDAQRALQQSEERFELAMRGSHDGVFDWDWSTNEVYYSPRWKAMLGYADEELPNRLETWERLTEPQDRERAWNRIRDYMEGRRDDFQQEIRMRHKDGHWVDILSRAFLVRDETGKPVRTVGTHTDISPQRMAERALREERAFLEHIMDGIEDMIFVVDRQRRILRMNRAARMQAEGQDIAMADCHCYAVFYKLKEPCPPNQRTCPLNQVWKTGQPGQALHRMTDADGRERTLELSASPMRDADGRMVAVIQVLRDVTDRRELMEQLRLQDLKYAHLAQHDPLTDLPNRFLFSDRLDQAIRVAQRDATKLAVLLLDVDDFKQVNDSFDHNHGDTVLIAIAQRLQEFVHGVDTLARMGGDEFGVLLSAVDHDEDPAKVARALLALFKEPFEVDGHRIFLGISIGISLYPAHGEDNDALIRNADSALFRAKADGRNSFQYYSQDLTTIAFERILLESSLHDAIANDELVLHYQPQLHLETGAIFGVEALVRWQHPSMGLVPPDRFIALAESTGLILPLGAWVLQAACAQMTEWLQQCMLPKDALMSVNVSVRQLANSDLTADVESALQRNGLAADRLELEITESTIMDSPEQSTMRLNRLRELGVKLAIDDFGTGYSSLSYLKRLPFTKLKIDRSFVSDIPQDANDVAITKAVIAIASSLGLETLAEGIETEHQRQFLLQQGCLLGQGYLFSRPLAAADLARFVSDLD